MPPKKKPTNRDTKEDDRVRSELKRIAERFPHRDQFEKDLTGADCDARAVCARSIAYLEGNRRLSEARFWLDASCSNYLTLLYYTCDPPRWKEAMKQNEETLRREPRNFNALWCKCEIHWRQMMYGPVNDALKLLVQVLDDPVAMTTAKAELGTVYPDLGPSFYQKSKTLLEEAIAETSRLPEALGASELLKSRLVKWKFNLVRTYNRLMNKGTIHTYWDPSLEPSPSHVDLFKRVQRLLCDVTSANDVNFSAEGWVELGDAYKKYEENVPQGQRTESLPDEMTLDDCFERALDLGPDDLFVLERCGRHYRQRASGIEDFEKAIGMLSRCVEIDPLRDVAHHHLGLAYRSMWLEKEDHEEAKLHTNPVRRTGKNPRRKTSRSDSSQSEASNPESLSRRDSNVSSNSLEETDKSVEIDTHSGRINSRSAGDVTLQNGVELCGSTGTPMYGRAYSSPARFRQTISPRFPKPGNEVPKHYRKPDYYDTLRAGNPLAKDFNHPDLLKARSCFQTAADIRQGKSSRYLIDLARTYLSTNDLRTARDLFLRARDTDYNSNDGAYLFEQFGLMEEGRLETNQAIGSCVENGCRRDDDAEELVRGHEEHSSIEEVKNLFRQAIRYTAESRERSRIAFYHLRDILCRQKEETPSDILEEEYSMLFTTIQDSKKASEILENMKNDRSKVAQMWRLVKLFYERNRPEDPEAAFAYLAVLAKAEKLKENLTEEDSIDIRIEQVVEIGERRIQRSGDKIRDTLANTYEWLLALSHDEADEKKTKFSGKICLLAPSSDTPGVKTTMRILKHVMGIEFVRAFLNNSKDILGGCVPFIEVEEMVKDSNIAILNMQMIGEKPTDFESNMEITVRSCLNSHDYRPKRICQVVSGGRKRIPLGNSDALLNRWDLGDYDEEELNDQSHQTRLAFSLLRALFLSESNGSDP